ncbi:MAG: hypothetical protein U5N55_03070 [Cypionkella sp.]|nr:hypothetical protein [Cypionkella sp.]
MMKKYLLPGLTLAIGLTFAAAPTIAPEFRGYAAGQLPVAIERHAVQPAGYAFAIWGLIFAWLLASAAFGLLRRADHPVWARTRPALMGAMVLGTVWLFLASTQPLLATAVILVMAVCAIAAFLRADSGIDRWLLSAPLAIFAGWVSAASMVSVGIMLGGYGLLPHPTAALVMVAVLLAGAIYIQSRRPLMPVYGATVVWAIIAVAVVNRADQPMVAVVATAAALIMAAATTRARLRASLL